MKSVGIRGTGAYAPERVLTNDQIAKMVDTSDDWIRTRTGIRERRVAAEGETTSDLALNASRRALDAAGLGPQDLDLILVGTVTPDMVMPSCACHLQRKLGATRAGAVDLSAACTGFLYSLSTATGLIANGTCRNVLVVGAEILTRVVDWTDRNTCVLFGDGAGAAVLSEGAPHQVLDTTLHADGSDPEVLTIPGGGSAFPTSQRTLDSRLHLIKMKGRDIFRFAVTKMAELIESAAARHGVPVQGINLVVPHQVNQRIIEAATEKVGLPPERVYMNIQRFGNTSAASIPMALDEVVRAGLLKEGDLLVMVAFGGGLTWASASVRW